MSGEPLSTLGGMDRPAQIVRTAKISSKTLVVPNMGSLPVVEFDLETTQFFRGAEIDESLRLLFDVDLADELVTHLVAQIMQCRAVG